MEWNAENAVGKDRGGLECGFVLGGSSNRVGSPMDGHRGTGRLEMIVLLVLVMTAVRIVVEAD